jgi:hypothetical protein
MLTSEWPSDCLHLPRVGSMLLRSPESPGHVSGPTSEGRPLRRIVLITLGALLLAPAVSYASSVAAALPTTISEPAGCLEVSPGPANLLGAMEGQPPLPGQGVWVATTPRSGGCPTG